MKKLAAAAFCFFALLPGPAGARGDRSLTNSEWSPQPPRGRDAGPCARPAVPFPAFDRKAAPAENYAEGQSPESPRPPLLLPLPRFPSAPSLAEARLREQISLLRSTVAELTESLALANAEAETFRRQGEELALRLDSLGLLDLGGNPESLEQKLLSAVRELRIQQTRNIETENALIALSEAVIALLQETPGIDPQLRLDIEAQLRKANEILAGSPDAAEEPPVEATLTDALVLDTRPEISLVIANVGSKQGVRIGTPFRILRGSQIIGTALAVDVRDRISGAIVQNLTQETQPARKGDRLTVITKQ